MKLTAKQRAKIYREAAEYFATADWYNGHWGFCSYVHKKGYGDVEFKEIQMFELNSDNNIWYLEAHDSSGPPINNHNQRVMCLLLAEQIALNP